jgi:CrcB protein
VATAAEPEMTRFLLVGIGGFLGAMARYGVSLAAARLWSGEFPLGTFLANVSGCFALGLFVTLSTERLAVEPGVRLLVATGFLGAYTTFSTFEYETHRLLETGALGWAALNAAASVGAGLAAVRLGVALGR